MTDSPEIQSSPQGNKGDPRQSQRKHGITARWKSGLFIMLLFVGLIFFSHHKAVVTIDCTPEIIASNPDIIMLGAWWCTYCRQAKAYFQNSNIHYCEYDMEHTATGKQLYEKHGGGLPVLLIGKYQLNGFDKQQVEKALSLLER